MQRGEKSPQIGRGKLGSFFDSAIASDVVSIDFLNAFLVPASSSAIVTTMECRSGAGA